MMAGGGQGSGSGGSALQALISARGGRETPRTMSEINVTPFVDVMLALNDKGIAVTFNVGNPNVNATLGLPPVFMVRHVMEKAKTLKEAVTIV